MVLCNMVIIGSGNNLLPLQHQAITWTNAGILSIQPLGTNSMNSESAKWQPFCPSLAVLNIIYIYINVKILLDLMQSHQINDFNISSHQINDFNISSHQINDFSTSHHTITHSTQKVRCPFDWRVLIVIKLVRNCISYMLSIQPGTFRPLCCSTIKHW